MNARTTAPVVPAVPEAASYTVWLSYTIIAKHAKPARQRIFKHWLCTVARKHLQMRLIRWQAAAAMLGQQQQNGTQQARFPKNVKKPQT